VAKRKQSSLRWISSATIVGLCLFQFVCSPSIGFAATNQATGSIATDASALTGSNVVDLTTTTLALVKAAFLANGTPVTTGSTLARGTLVKFVIYVDNTTGAPVDSVNVSDVLDATFAYQAGTIKVDSSLNTGATAAAIYAAVNASTAVTDAISAGDVAGVNGSTIRAGQGAGNANILVPASTVWAMIFTVKMQ